MSRGRQRRNSASAKPPSLRVVGGEWRGRRLTIADAPGLRPTPNRIRETLFNWLAPLIEGARCIDLFAGTGALGIEALSRGAAHVTLVEREAAAAAAIASALAQLEAGDRARVVTGDALRAPTVSEPVDIVFIDPPFDAQLHGAALRAIAPVTGPNTRLYLEYPAAASDEIAALMADDYACLRRGRASSVGYCLARACEAGEHKPL